MIKEHNFITNERNKQYENSDLKDGEEWVEVTDFDTGKKKKIKRVKSV